MVLADGAGGVARASSSGMDDRRRRSAGLASDDGVAPAGGGGRPKGLLEAVRDRLRAKHYSLRTEAAYLGWIRRFIQAHRGRHPRELGGREVGAFLTRLAVQGNVAASTQNQALSALLFLYREVLGLKLPWMEDVVRAKRPRRLPSVLSQDEVRALLELMQGRPRVLAALLYGSGMRLMEGLRLRIKDVDFDRREILVRDGKGGKDRRTMLPSSLEQPLREAIARALRLHAADLAAGHGRTWLPHALARKYPNAATEPGWQYVFPSDALSEDPRDGTLRRHHVGEEALSRHRKQAARRLGLAKPVSAPRRQRRAQPARRDALSRAQRPVSSTSSSIHCRWPSAPVVSRTRSTASMPGCHSKPSISP